MTCGIYLIKNKITGQMYVGQSVDIENRWYQHRKSTPTIRVDYAIQKYGADNFEIELLEELPYDDELLDIEETFWIEYLGVQKHKLHYNVAKGGKGNRGFTHKQNVRDKISSKNSGKNNGMYKGYPTISKNGHVNGKQQYCLRYGGKIIARSHDISKLESIRDYEDWNIVGQPRVSLQKAGSANGKQKWVIYYKKRELKSYTDLNLAKKDFEIAKYKLEQSDNRDFYKKNLILVLPSRKKGMSVEKFNNPTWENRGYTPTKRNNLIMSNNSSSTGIYHVTRDGNRYRYWYFENGKKKSLISADIEELKKKVLEHKLEWIEFDGVDSE